jgi:hypothetical protein
MARFSRRAFLALAALFAPLGASRRSLGVGGRPDVDRVQPTAVPLDDFMALSQRLVGRPRLDAQAGAIYLSALTAVPGNPALLAQLARGRLQPRTGALERAIIESWGTPGSTRSTASGGSRRTPAP